MKDYDFYTRRGHGAMKDFVQDYYRRIQSVRFTCLPVRAQQHTNFNSLAWSSFNE